jgi:hypothetical protein
MSINDLNQLKSYAANAGALGLVFYDPHVEKLVIESCKI